MRKVFCLSFLLIVTACTNTSLPPTPTDLRLLTPTSSPAPTTTSVPATPTSTPYPTLVPESSFIKGITLNESGFKLDSDESFEVIKRYIIPSGANYIALIPTCVSEDYSDTHIVCNLRENNAVSSPTDQEIINAIAHLHQSGLRVILKPQALVMTELVEHRYSQRGEKWSETEWKQWFDSYATFIIHYAKLAENNHVDLFVIGNEQQDTTQREEDWRDIIAAVRKEYHGPITYAANAWQFEASRIHFWDALDFIGTNGYFGYVNKNTPSVDEMKQAWTPIVQKLEEMSLQYGKPVLITEIGAGSSQNNNTGQLFWWSCSSYDGQEQDNYYRAFFEVLADKPWLKGIVLWGLDTDPFQGGVEDTSSTFVEKPAQQLVHQYFNGIQILPTPTVAPSAWIEDPTNSLVMYDDSLRNGWKQYRDPNMPAAQLDATTAFQGEHSIYFPATGVSEIQLYLDDPYIEMSKYKWLEFYVLVKGNKPSPLYAVFAIWTPQGYTWSRGANIDNPYYLETDSLKLKEWQRVRIPLVDLGITDQKFAELHLMRSYRGGCNQDVANDVYIDNLQLIATKQ